MSLRMRIYQCAPKVNKARPPERNSPFTLPQHAAADVVPEPAKVTNCIGFELANVLVRPFSGDSLSERDTLILAAYTLAQVKHNVPGCGGESISTHLPFMLAFRSPLQDSRVVSKSGCHLPSR